MAASRKMKNAKGEWITYTAAGKKKDPATWAKLDKQAWMERAKRVGIDVKSSWSTDRIKRETQRAERTASMALGQQGETGGDSVRVGSEGPASTSQGGSAIEQEFGALPPAFETEPRAPIGVPSDYSVTRETTRRGFGGIPKSLPRKEKIGPRYFDGAQWKPASLSPDDVARLQADLIAAGLLSKKDVQLGRWGPESAKAYEEILTYANASGLSVDQALARYKAQPVQAQGAERAPLVVEQTDPAVLRGTFREVGRALTGRDLSTEDLDRFVNAYRAIEAQKQQERYELAETGGTITAPPDAQSFLEEKLRTERPEDVKAYGIGSRADEFFSLLATPGNL